MAHWTERHKVLLAVYLVLRRPDGRVLLSRRAGTGYMDDKLGMPAYHADGDEPADTIQLI
jgi:8-oxo-dGTP diphosphatase